MVAGFPDYCDSQNDALQTVASHQFVESERPQSGAGVPVKAPAETRPEVPSTNYQAQQLESQHVHKACFWSNCDCDV